MKIKIFGKETEIKTEAAVAAAAALALLGMLTGYLFFSDKDEIIIESAKQEVQERASPAGDASQPGTEMISAPDDTSADHKSANGGSYPDRSAENSSGNNTVNDGGSGDTEEKILVYVVGCVKKPGIVEIQKGGLICDAVEAAGGLTEDADAENINMVYSLNENVMLHIKSKQDSNNVGDGAAVYTDAGPAAEVAGSSGDVSGSGKPALVNINTADIEELDTLPGIGEATARDIIAYREKVGGFTSIEDIMNVPRIKQNRFESIKDFITVD